jgi:hypothetical protein
MNEGNEAVSIQPRWKFYTAAGAIVLISSVGTLYLPIQPLFKSLSAVPGIAALIVILARMVLDEIEYERRLALLAREQSFALAATSSIAALVFQKQAEFVDRYVGKAYAIRDHLGTHGPEKGAGELAMELRNLRVQYAAWVPTSTEMYLVALEDVLFNISARSRLLDLLPVSDERTAVVQQIFDDFVKVLPLKKDPDSELALARIPGHFRRLLGTDQLSSLRQAVIDALATIPESKVLR